MVLSPRIIKRSLVILLTVLLFALALWLSGTHQFFLQLFELPVEIIFIVLALQLTNLFVVSLRFWRVMAHFGIVLPWKVASRACVSGHVAGMFMISLLGQVMGRNAILRKCGIEPVVISGIAAYERVILVIISGSFGFFGLLWLFGQQYLFEIFNDYTGIQIIITIFLACLLSFWIGGSRFEKGMLKNSVSWINGLRLIETIAITLLGLTLTLTCFVVVESAIPGVSANFIDLFAAAAVISFAATMPITVNGWGIREVASIFVLDKLGYSTTDAVLVSVVVGLCSMLVILGMIPSTIKPFSRFKTFKKSMSCLPIRSSHIDIAKIAGWCFGMAAAVAVFFQAHIEMSGGKININLADPFAILAFAAVVQKCIATRRMPEWRYHLFNQVLIVITTILLFGFFRGWFEIGITQWALGGRLLGWMVLLGYVSAGYLLVSYGGLHGLRRFSETIITTAAVVVVIQMIIRFLPDTGRGNFQGFSANRNAFAFQLLVAMALALGYSKVFCRRGLREFYFSIMLALIFCGLIWSASRAGLGTALIMLIGASLFRLTNTRIILLSVALAAIVCFTFFGVHSIQNAQGLQSAHIQSSFSHALSDNERWATLVHGWDLWLESPIFGAGLGVFYEKSPIWIGRPQVIHNTMLWLLAEFGILGLAAFISVFYGLFRFVVITRQFNNSAILLMILTGFAIFSQAHEIFYQRIFWLVLGALLAKPIAHKYVNKQAQ